MKNSPHGLFRWFPYISIGILLVVVLGIAAYPIILYRNNKPDLAVPVYPVGDTFDYFTYLAMIKSGEHGEVAYNDRYTQIVYSKPVMLPEYGIVGLITRPFGLSTPVLYHLLRFSVLIGLCFAVYCLAVLYINDPVKRFSAFIVFIAAGGFWTGSLQNAKGLIHYAAAFDPFRKFLVPPHHILGLVGLIVYIISLRQRPDTTKKALTLAVIAMGTVILNPVIGITLVFITVSIFIYTFLFHRVNRTTLAGFLIIFMTIGITLGYYTYLFRFVPPWPDKQAAAMNAPSGIDIKTYLLSLGPTLPVSLLAIVPIILRFNPIGMALSIWAFVPIALFILSKKGFSMEDIRIYQSYQYIPLSLLAVTGLEWIASRIPRAKKLGLVLVCVFATGTLVYTIPLVKTGMNEIDNIAQAYDYHLYVPYSTMAAFTYLASHTAPESVVLSGNFSSNMLPAFSDNRVVRGGLNMLLSAYGNKQTQIETFYSGGFSLLEQKAFLDQYHISYVMCGMDAPCTIMNKEKELFTQIFKDEPVRIFAVR
jgi:hypothetical protein